MTCKECGHYAVCGYVEHQDIECNHFISKSALEKQIPKKPTHEASLYKSLTCPNCKNVIDEFTEFIPNQPKIRVTTQYCKFCGQALDWSDAE